MCLNSSEADGLQRAFDLQGYAAKLGFDWPDVWPVLEKAEEEIHEIREALREGNSVLAAEELGDLLFTAVNVARFLKADPEQELLRCAARFEERFTRVKEEVLQRKGTMDECSLEELDEIWERVKNEPREMK